MVFYGEQEKESVIRVRMGSKNTSLVIIVCHHSASLVMPYSDPRDVFFDPTLTLMMDSYNLNHVILPTRLSRVGCSLVILELKHIVVNGRRCYSRNEFNIWNVLGIMNTVGLLQRNFARDPKYS